MPAMLARGAVTGRLVPLIIPRKKSLCYLNLWTMIIEGNESSGSRHEAFVMRRDSHSGPAKDSAPKMPRAFGAAAPFTVLERAGAPLAARATASLRDAAAARGIRYGAPIPAIPSRLDPAAARIVARPPRARP